MRISFERVLRNIQKNLLLKTFRAPPPPIEDQKYFEAPRPPPPPPQYLHSPRNNK